MWRDVAAEETGVPLRVKARELIERCHPMRRKAETNLESRLEQGRSGLVASFASRIAKDISAVPAAIKPKLVKRQMNSRGKLALLQASLVRTA